MRYKVIVTRQIKRASTATCTLPIYMGFLMTEPNSISCTQLAETYNISHDSVNRFLERESYTPDDLYKESIQHIDNNELIISVDDTVLDKPYSQCMSLVGYFWSGKHHRSVKGINLITLYATDQSGRNLPINFRIYDKSENKTKNDYFLDMLNQILSWGANIAWITADSWYSSTANLKTIKKHGIKLMMGIDSNRKVSLEKGQWIQIRLLPEFKQGQVVWLKDFGFVQLFKTQLKEQQRFYIVHQNDGSLSYDNFNDIHLTHWKIEQYHRVIKQVCHIEKFQVRRSKLILNHIFAALMAYIEIQKRQYQNVFENIYRWQKELFRPIIKSFIDEFILDKNHLLPHQLAK